MLGFLISPDGREADALLADLANRLSADGRRVAGAVQIDTAAADALRCDMDLRVLTGGEVIRISQNLGSGATGCRLDPAGLETAVGLVEATLTASAGPPPDILIVNKFGKQEIDGRGFRPVIGAAIAAEIPVIVGVRPASLPGFHAFAGDLADEIPATPDALLAWVGAVLGRTGKDPA